MDFQRWIYRGVALTDAAGEAAVRSAVKRRDEEHIAFAKANAASSRDQLTPEERKWFDASLERVKKFADAPAGSLLRITREESLPSIRSSAAVAALQLTVEADAIEGVKIIGKGRQAFRDAVIVRSSTKEVTEVKKRELTDLIGFRRCFAAMVASRKPIISHNSFADWLFLLQAADQPLPPTLKEFKQRMQELFPTVYDTKIIAAHADVVANKSLWNPPAQAGRTAAAATETPRFINTHLGTLYDTYVQEAAYASSTSPLSRCIPWLPLGFHNYAQATLMKKTRGGNSAAAAAHEAAFDALMTGTVFYCLQQEYGTAVTESCKNKLGLFRSLFSVDLTTPSTDVFLPRGGVAVEVAHPWGDNYSLLDGYIRRLLALAPPKPSADSSTAPDDTSALSTQLLYTCGKHAAGAAVVAIDGPKAATELFLKRHSAAQAAAGAPAVAMQLLRPAAGSNVMASISPSVEFTSLAGAAGFVPPAVGATKKGSARQKLRAQIEMEMNSLDLRSAPTIRRMLRRALTRR